MSLIRSHILVCTGTGCTSSNSLKIIEEFEKQLVAQGMDKEAKVVRTGCFGLWTTWKRSWPSTSSRAALSSAC